MSSPIIIAISIFIIFIAFNLYIRVRTFGFYKQLVQRRIQFRFNDIFSKKRWQGIIEMYPDDAQLLNAFRTHMVTTGLLFIIVIVVVLILLYFLRTMH